MLMCVYTLTGDSEMPKGNPYGYQGTQQAPDFGKGKGMDPGSKTSAPQTGNKKMSGGGKKGY